jgi:hypothetical protein
VPALTVLADADADAVRCLRPRRRPVTEPDAPASVCRRSRAGWRQSRSERCRAGSRAVRGGAEHDAASVGRRPLRSMRAAMGVAGMVPSMSARRCSRPVGYRAVAYAGARVLPLDEHTILVVVSLMRSPRTRSTGPSPMPARRSTTRPGRGRGLGASSALRRARRAARRDRCTPASRRRRRGGCRWW